jgi:hypothetical protein
MGDPIGQFSTNSVESARANHETMSFKDPWAHLSLFKSITCSVSNNP